MSVSFTNEEIVDGGFLKALGMLTAKPLPPKAAWNLADIIGYVQARAKKFHAAREALAKRHAIAEGTLLDSLAPEVRAEFTELDEVTEDMPVDPISLPVMDAAGKEIWYEPMIFVALKKLIKREEAGK